MSNDDEESGNENLSSESLKDALPALSDLSKEKEETAPERINSFWQLQEVEAYKARIPNVINSFLLDTEGWTPLEIAYLWYVDQCATPEEAVDNFGRLKAHIASNGVRLHHAITKLFPNEPTRPLYAERRNVWKHFNLPRGSDQCIDPKEAIAYLLKRNIRPDRFSEEILREFDTWKAKAWGAESLSESGERAHPALQSNFETNAAPRIEAKKRTLPPLCQDILLVHLRESTSEYSMLPLDVGRGKVGLLDALERFGRSPDLDSVKRGNKELRGRGLICTKSGPRGGAYLTEAGRAEAEKIRAAR